MDQLAKAGAAAPLMPTQRCAYYTIDKREAPDRAWALVVRVLEQLGFEGLDSEDSSSRTATIPEALLREFEACAADPEPSLWIPSPPNVPPFTRTKRAPPPPPSCYCVRRAARKEARSRARLSRNPSGTFPEPAGACRAAVAGGVAHVPRLAAAAGGAGGRGR